MISADSLNGLDLPGSRLDAAKMPGHWLLARLGKRVLRPGGLAMTRSLISQLQIDEPDDVVEFAPGLGATARLILAQKPRSYVGIERDARAAHWTLRRLPEADRISLIVGAADRTTLPDSSASVVVGEAMLSMNSDAHKREIAAEAFRLLRPGGRFGIHELCAVPEDLATAHREAIDRGLSSAIHVGVRLLPLSGWIALVEQAGFRVVAAGDAPMHLLRVQRLLEDEGVAGALRFARNLILDGAARRRVGEMRRTFERFGENLRAIYLVARKDAR